MSHRKLATKEQKNRSSSPDSNIGRDRGSTKAELIEMVKVLQSKILENSDKSAKILSDWIHQGKPTRKK
jgi:hypothetical protein